MRALLFGVLLGCWAAGLRAEELPADGFFAPPAFVQPRLSPDGHRLAARTLHDGRHYALVLVDLESQRSEVLVKEPTLTVEDFTWSTDQRILFTSGNEKNGHTVQTLDLSTRKAFLPPRLNQELNDSLFAEPALLPSRKFPDFRLRIPGNELFPPLWGELQNPPFQPKKRAPLLHLSAEMGALPVYQQSVPIVFPADLAGQVLLPWRDGGIRRVDVRTDKSSEIARSVRGIDYWIVDPHGGIWAGAGFCDEKWRFVWRASQDAKWQVREQPGRHDAELFPLDIMPDRKRLVVLQRPPAADTARLAFFDLATTELTEIFAREDRDISAVERWGFLREPCAALYHTDRAERHFFQD